MTNAPAFTLSAPVNPELATARVVVPEPVPLLDLFAPLEENRHRTAFDRLPRETRADILRWADPRDQFGELLDPVRPH